MHLSAAGLTSQSPPRIYDQKLAKTLKGLLEKHQDVFIRDGHTRGIDVPQAMSSKSIREFDEFLTTKSFGAVNLPTTLHHCSFLKSPLNCTNLSNAYIRRQNGTAWTSTTPAPQVRTASRTLRSPCCVSKQTMTPLRPGKPSPSTLF